METQRKSHLRSFVGAGAIALGVAITLNAPAANAERISEGTIKSECRAAGGTYSTSFYKGIGERHSSCTYKDEDGDTWTDVYTNGEYQGTDPA